MNHLIIGKGEVGEAIFKILSPHYNVQSRDIEDAHIERGVDVLHIAYPPHGDFVETTKGYGEKYKPKLIIVHSTVSVGTTKEIGEEAVHSPIRGMHPNLTEGIKTFVKYFGGPKAKEAAKIFEDLDIPTRVFEKAETTELAKF